MVRYADIGKTVVVLTYHRPEPLRTIVDEVNDNLHTFGHDNDGWGITVVDDSNPHYAERNRAVLAEVKNGVPLFYFGPKEYKKFADDVGEGFYRLFEGHGAADTRNMAALLTTGKTVITLDDDMRPYETVAGKSVDTDYPSLLSTGEFYPTGEAQEGLMVRPVDLVSALTSHLGRRVSETGIPAELMGRAVGDRDKVVDRYLSGTDDQGHAFCAIDPDGEIDPDALIRWQAVSAITGKTDCHATASIQGLGSEAARYLTPQQYGNLFVDYAIHDRERRVGLATQWQESTLAAFGMLNTSPLPALPLKRGEDVSYRQLIGPTNPVALSSRAIDHNRSPDGRPDLSRIYFDELLGAKACKVWRRALEGMNGSLALSRSREEMVLGKSAKRDVHKSMRTTCEILNGVHSNGNPALAHYAGTLLRGIEEVFYNGDSRGEGNFWENGNFKDAVMREAERYFRDVTETLYGIFGLWPGLVAHAKTEKIPVTEI